MEWIPVFLVTFKALVFGIGMFLAIKWHYDKEKAEKAQKAQAQLQAEQPPPAATTPLTAANEQQAPS
jgi:sortase (surface protein transpeptidase)